MMHLLARTGVDAIVHAASPIAGKAPPAELLTVRAQLVIDIRFPKYKPFPVRHRWYTQRAASSHHSWSVQGYYDEQLLILPRR